MKYRIYIDEVGNSDLESSDNPNHRFLSLTGVIVELDQVENVIHPQMEKLKYRYFKPHPDEPVIFHRKEMINCMGPYIVLKNPEIRRNFDKDLLDRLKEWDYTVISVCIDKKNHKETYQTWRYDPYHYCLALILERFVFFLNRHKSQGDVMAESRGGKADRRLKDSFTHLWEHGSDFIDPDQFQKVLTSKQLKVKPKANNIAGLQLADILAYPSRNEILKENGFIEKPLASFTQKIDTILQKKYDKSEGRIFGKKFI